MDPVVEFARAGLTEKPINPLPQGTPANMDELLAAHDNLQVLVDALEGEVRNKRNLLVDAKRVKRNLAGVINKWRPAKKRLEVDSDQEYEAEDIYCARVPKCPECGKARHLASVDDQDPCPFFQWAKAYGLMPVQLKRWSGVRAHFVDAEGKYARPASTKWDGSKWGGVKV